MFDGRQVIDVTRSIISGMTVWPGDPGLQWTEPLPSARVLLQM